MPEPPPLRGPYPPGRRCTHPGCITVLSTHHEAPAQKCYAHEARRLIVQIEPERLGDMADDLQELIEA